MINDHHCELADRKRLIYRDRDTHRIEDLLKSRQYRRRWQLNVGMARGGCILRIYFLI